MILVIALFVACGERERDPSEDEPVSGDTSPAADTASAADSSTPSLPVTDDGWAQIGDCEVRLVAPPVLPPPVPAQCAPGPPGWVGDFNGDGVDDLAIAATRAARVDREAGAVYVLAGVDTTP